jgi:hypothetical protein
VRSEKERKARRGDKKMSESKGKKRTRMKMYRNRGQGEECKEKGTERMEFL